MRRSFTKVSVANLMALSVASSVCLVFGTANAAEPVYCVQYAWLALHEVKANMATPGCFKGFDHRWNLNFQGHYDWCLTATVAAVNAERDYRRMRVAQCQAR